MITFIDALSLIRAQSFSLESITINTSNSLGAHVARDIYAPIDLPPFDNSAVDGFAVRCHEIVVGQSMPIAAVVRAVAQVPYELQAESCVKIMTGSPIPLNADAVIMKEDADELGSRVRFLKTPLCKDHIRRRGEDLKRGELVAKAGQRVTPQLLGLLLGLGLAVIQVFRMPRVTIICTGDELVDPPQKLGFGQVYFLLGSMLQAQCQALGIDGVRVLRVADRLEAIKQTLEEGLSADLVLITGGMSKGEYDLVRPALGQMGVKEIFYQGYWRPGKPLYFGRRANTCVFGLPGNPVATFVGFRVFVQTWLNAVLGLQDEPLKYATLVADLNKTPNFALFARAQVDAHNRLTILKGQGSHEIFSLSKANALCYVPAGIAQVQAGVLVAYWPCL